MVENEDHEFRLAVTVQIGDGTATALIFVAEPATDLNGVTPSAHYVTCRVDAEADTVVSAIRSRRIVDVKGYECGARCAGQMRDGHTAAGRFASPETRSVDGNRIVPVLHLRINRWYRTNDRLEKVSNITGVFARRQVVPVVVIVPFT
jgi:hypothetical protein